MMSHRKASISVLVTGLAAQETVGRGGKFARRQEMFFRVRAAMLLEVVLAVAILAGALAMIGGQINGSFVTNIETGKLTDAVFLAEAKMAEIDSGLVTFEEELEGE